MSLRLRSNWLLWLMVAIVLALPLQADEFSEKIDKIFAPWDNFLSPGCILGIVRDGKLIYTRGYGMADFKKGQAITKDSVFRIASTSKQFTAACIALLVQDGTIRLEDDIRDYIRELPRYKYKVTIGDLVYHTSGIPDYIGSFYEFNVSGKYQQEIAVGRIPQGLRRDFADRSEKLSEASTVHEIAKGSEWMIDDPTKVYTYILFPSWTKLGVRFEFRQTGATSERVVAYTSARPMKKLEFRPGNKHQYSNTGYVLLGEIVKRASGYNSLREFAQERIFKPLQMNKTVFYDSPDIVIENRVMGYRPAVIGYELDMSKDTIVGDGAILTTVGDLFRWDQNFYDNKLGGGQALIAMLTTPGKVGKTVGDYAFGLVIEKVGGYERVWHNGAWVGFRSIMVRIPELKLSVICLCNLSSMEPDDLAEQVIAVCLENR